MKQKTIMIDDVEYVRLASIKKQVDKLEGLTYSIIRTYSAGCFAGYINRDREDKNIATVKNARRLWSWSGASSLSQLANEGVKNPEKCKFPVEVAEIDLCKVIEVTPATKEAKKSIDSVNIWKQ